MLTKNLEKNSLKS